MPGVAFCFKEINPCLENHGGCHQHAECTQTGPNQVSCVSAGAYVFLGANSWVVRPRPEGQGLRTDL